MITLMAISIWDSLCNTPIKRDCNYYSTSLLDSVWTVWVTRSSLDAICVLLVSNTGLMTSSATMTGWLRQPCSSVQCLALVLSCTILVLRSHLYLSVLVIFLSVSTNLAPSVFIRVLVARKCTRQFTDYQKVLHKEEEPNYVPIQTYQLEFSNICYSLQLYLSTQPLFMFNQRRALLTLELNWYPCCSLLCSLCLLYSLGSQPDIFWSS